MNTLEDIEADIYNCSSVNRNHLLAFLRLQDTSDAATLKEQVSDWLTKLHHDPHFSRVRFANNPLQDKGPIESIIDDLTTYGHIQPKNTLPEQS